MKNLHFGHVVSAVVVPSARSFWIYAILFLVRINPVNAQDDVTILKNVLLTDTLSASIVLANERIDNVHPLQLFYKSTQYVLAWDDNDNVNACITAIRNSIDEGLEPSDYHLATLEQLRNQSQKTDTERIALDVLLTDAFMSYATHLFSGKASDQLYPDKWEADKKSTLDLPALLNSALRDKTITATFERLKPSFPQYEQLKSQLKSFRNLKNLGGWPLVPADSAFQVGVADGRVPLLIKRLVATGQLPALYVNKDQLFDSTLIKAIQKFQQQHGLKADGVIGMYTFHNLNHSVDHYIDVIRVNLERYRWLPQKLGNSYVSINIPEFQLEVHEGDSLIMSMKVIVGKPERSTPVFSSTIHYLILNPTWTVPPTILKEDALPALKADIQYLDRHNLRVIDKKGNEVDPSVLPWESFTERNFPYQLRQDPGPNNSLGLIKFQFPNHYQVFLHDTNMHNLFLEANRALSSGCIRLEYPFRLASYLLKDTKWSAKEIDKMVLSGKTSTIIFQESVPIHIWYFTAVVTKYNSLQMRNDLYDLDGALMEALSGHPMR